MRKVLLVKPYTYLHAYQNLELPLGIMMLSAYLKRELPGETAVTLIDLRVEKEREAALAKALDAQPDIIGLSIMNFEKTFLKERLAAVRAAAPRALIVAGGAYPTCNTEEALKEFPELDLVVRGEGEETFLAVVRRHAAGEDPRGEPGTAFLRDDAVVVAPDRPLIVPLDRLPMPDYEAVDIERYLMPHTPMNAVNADRRYVILMTSRGCPYRCAYCHDTMGKSFRPRSAERVLEEIGYLYERHGIREIHIVDDVFNLDRDRMHRILRGIAASGMKLFIAFPNGIRGDLLTGEDIDLMKAAGVYHLLFPLETASLRLQELVGKQLDLDRAMDNIRYAHRCGIVTKACFMLGFPGETEEELERTATLALDPALDMMAIYKVAYFRHTRIARMAEELWGADAEEPVDYYSGRSRYERATGIPLNSLITRTYLRFYLSWRMIRLLWRLPRRLPFLSRLRHHASLVRHVHASGGRRERNISAS